MPKADKNKTRWSSARPLVANAAPRSNYSVDVARIKVDDGAYTLKRRGLYFDDGDTRRRISAYVRPVAHTISPDGDHMGLKIKFKTINGETKFATVPRSTLMSTPDLLRLLVDKGFPVPPNSKDAALIGKFINELPCVERIRQVASSGWCRVKTPNGSYASYFILGKKVFGPKIDDYSVESTASIDGRFAIRGTVKEWRKNVGKLCRGNVRVMYAVCSALSAPLLRLCDFEPDITHFAGNDSSQGKTTALYVAASLFGNPRKNYRTWSMTAAGLEGECALYNDLPLIIDELGQVPPEQLGQMIYFVVSGKGKGRGTVDGSARPRADFRNKALSAGEVGAADHMLKGGNSIKAGQEIRILSVPVVGQSGMFKDLHGQTSSEVFVDTLKKNAFRYHGAVGQKFIGFITKDRGQVKRQLAKKLPKIGRDLGRWVNDMTLTNAEKRVLQRMRLTALAGELATYLNLTGWRAGEAKDAVAKVLRIWLKTRREAPTIQRKEILDKIRLALTSAKFVPLSKVEGELPTDHAGYRHTLKGKNVYLIRPRYFKRVVCKGMKRAMCVQALRDAKLLITDRDRTDKQVRVPGLKKKPMFIVIRRSIKTA